MLLIRNGPSVKKTGAEFTVGLARSERREHREMLVKVSVKDRVWKVGYSGVWALCGYV